MIGGWENVWFFAFALSGVLLLLLYLFKYKGELFFTQALFLWEEYGAQEKNSAQLTFRRLPLSFFLEAAALMLMVCGGASLFVVSKENLPPAVILLNNSYSMTPQVRRQGEKVLRTYLDRFPGRRVIWGICGTETELLSRGEKKIDLDKYWNGTASEFNGEQAVAWAKENFKDAEICLVTDRVPKNYVPGEISLFCCGTPGENVAIANAAVSEGRVLLEIRSFSSQKRNVVLKVNSQFLETFTIGSNGSKLFNFALESPAALLKFRVESPGNALEYDDEVILVNTPKKAVTYTYGKLLPAEKKVLSQVLEHNPDFRQVTKGGALFFSSYPPDKKLPSSGNRVFFHRGKQSFLEKSPPFFSPREELLKGLENSGLVWAFTPGIKLPGRGIICSSSGALMSVEEISRNRYDIHLNLHPEYSNPASLPFWPGLFSNLAELCRRSTPGVVDHNVKSNEMILCNLSDGAAKVHYRHAGSSGEIPSVRGRALFRLSPKGLYTLDDGKLKYNIAVNPHVTPVSDLRQNKTFTAFSRKMAAGGEYRRYLSWIFTAAALLILTVNRTLLCRRSRRS